jgi:hypothetical protein
MTVAEQERQRDLADVRKLMDSVDGRRVVFRLLKTSGCLDRPGVMTDPAAISYYEGKRSIGFDLLADVMDVASKKFMVMILEAKERSDHMAALLGRERESGNEED